MIREELMQAESNLSSAAESLRALRARATATEQTRNAEPTAVSVAMGHSFVDLRPLVREAERRVDALTEQRAALAAQVAAAEANPAVRAARSKLEAAERDARTADAAAVRVLREVVAPALDRLREAHAKALEAGGEARRLAVALAESRGERPDFLYSVAGTTFGDFSLPADTAGAALVAQVLLSKERA